MVSPTAKSIFEVDTNYHFFFALAVLIINATWSKHCGKVQKYSFKVQRYTFKVQKYTFRVQKYTLKLQKYTFRVKSNSQSTSSIFSNYNCILSKYKSALSKYKSILSNYKSILSKYKSLHPECKSTLFKKVQKYTFKLQKYTFKVQQYTFEVQKYTFKVYKSALSKYKSILSKYKVTFGTFGTESPESGTFLYNTFGSQNPSEPVPSKPREQSLTQSIEWFPEPVPGPRNPGTYPNLGTHRNRFPEPLEPVPGTSEPWSLSKPRNPLEPVPGTSEPWNLGILEPRTQTSEPIGAFPEPSRNFPGTRFFPEPPQLAQHTPKSILCRDPIAFCCWGKKAKPVLQDFFTSNFFREEPVSNIGANLYFMILVPIDLPNRNKPWSWRLGLFFFFFNSKLVKLGLRLMSFWSSSGFLFTHSPARV